MVIDLHHFSRGRSDVLNLLPAQQRRGIREVVHENTLVSEDFIQNFAGMKRVTVDRPVFLTRKS